MTHEIFISYSVKDKGVADAINNGLGKGEHERSISTT
jgi:hypothetical protein